MGQNALEAGHHAAPQGRLAELLACERELAELLAAAREEARRRVEDARSEAANGEAELAASLEAEAERVRREVRETAQARVLEILGRARQQVDRFEALSDVEVARLAAAALRRLLGVEERRA